MRLKRSLWHCGLVLACVLSSANAHAGAQSEEALADSVRVLLRQAVSGSAPMARSFGSLEEERGFYLWRDEMAWRISKHQSEPSMRMAILNTVDYEARRAGLEVALVLGVMDVESRFKPQAKSAVGALGLMQVMPFWSRAIGDGRAQTLYNLRVNVRFGCTILRHYLDRENGDVVRALARYNGSLGQTGYAHKVLSAAMKYR